MGAVDSPGDEGLVVFMFATLAVVVNSLILVRRTRAGERPRRRASDTMVAPDELDARTVLDLDARLERLERAQADATDAARWRALVESGQVSGPSAASPQAGGAPLRGHTRNGSD